MSSGRLAGKVALVTAAGSGIGMASAVRFGREGAAVMVNALHEESVATVVEEIKSTGGDSLGFAT
jgi:NAD(P)-dependent dehydrogenase (short-subunit alcohol dehydrogenase family)